MGLRELSILNKVRETLNDNDPNNYRWTQERLMEHLTDAQDDMCRQLPLLAKKVTINTTSGVETYHLPLDTTRVLSANTAGVSIPFISAEELDAMNPEWEDSNGSQYEYIVVNQLSQYEIRPYPTMTDSQSNPDNLAIKFRYSAMPLALGWDGTSDSIEQLVISPMWDFALRQYVIGMAFVDYGDASNLVRSQTAMGFYGREMQRAEKLSKKGFAKRILTTPYQGKVANRRQGRRG